ncbi:MAG TPA: phosphoribosylanthranilate isomerase [Thermoanaerobaculia bacterium]|nr:phosphoribosylanthranilate isomerase [Thermoanaerobaculia bacterium]
MSGVGAERFPVLEIRPWVKICGVTRPQDAALAVELGATLVGVNFWPRSKRRVEPARAREIVAAVSGRAPVVGVFVDEAPGRIEELLASVGFDLVQLHGDEPDDVVARFGPRALRALRAQPGRASAARKRPMKKGGSGGGGGEGGAEADIASAPDPGAAESGCFSLQQHAFPAVSGLDGCFALLLDGPAGERYGGTGRAWGWELARPAVVSARVPALIAGGIRPETAAEALALSGATGVDLASGVEASPGVKDPEKMKGLMESIRTVRERRTRG